MRIIVCGGRDYRDQGRVQDVLAEYRERHPTIVHGAARGADLLANYAAGLLGYPVEAHPADWDRYGRGAGRVRNLQMLDLGADLVIAFPGGRGTAHMVEIATAAGVPVRQVPPAEVET